MIKDKNGINIQVGDELNVPLDIFSTGIVVEDANSNLSLELKYEHKKIALKDLNYNFLNDLLIIKESVI